MGIRNYKKNDLKRAIYSAFQHVRAPKQLSLGREGSQSYEEVEELSGVLPETWDAVSPDVVRRHFQDLPCLGVEGFRFLLPAFMCYALDYLEDADDPVLEFTLYSLKKPKELDLQPLFLHRMASLSIPQRNAIQKFLAFVCEMYPDSTLGDLAHECLKSTNSDQAVIK